MDFFSFEAALLRLKGVLALQTDKEVAAALGMDPSAFNKRKARGSFPEAEVRALAAERHFDADYVLTGVAQTALEIIDAARAGTPLVKVGSDEAQLLQNYRSCSPADQEVVRQQAAFLATRALGVPPALTPDARYPKAVDVPAPTVHSPRKKGL